MSLPLTILLLLVIFAGLSLQFAGLYIRRGDRPACRKCGYDLTSHQPTNCPECNADLTHSDAIVRGVRRPRLIWFGTSMLLVGGLALTYLLVRSPGFDKHKPVWLMRAEMVVVNDEGDERIIKELTRRVQKGGVNPDEARAIGRLAVDLVGAAEPKASAYDLLKFSALVGGVSAEEAAPIMLDLIGQWTDEMRAERSFAHGNYLHREVLGALIRSTGLDLEKLRPVIQQGTEASVKKEPDYAFASMCSQLLWNWWESPSSPGIVTHELLTQLYQDAPELRLEVRPNVTKELGLVPYKFRYALPPNVGNEGDMVVFSERVERLLVRQGDRVLMPKYASFGGSSQTRQASRRMGYIVGTSSTAARIEGLQPGPAELEIEVHVKVIAGKQPEGEESPSGDMVNELPPVIDRTITITAPFHVVSAGEDEVRLLKPGEEDAPQPEVVLENLRVSPVYYSSAPPFGSQGPWALKIGLASLSHDQRGQEQWMWPKIDVAYLVIAEQGDHVWELGHLIRRDLLQARYHAMPVSGTLVPTRVGASGEREWAQPVPDFDQPVRIRLLPDEDRARQTIDMDTIYGVELDLGLFAIERTEDRSSIHQIQDYELRPVPALAD